MKPLIIFKVENGFLMMEDYSGHINGMGHEIKKWVATTPKDLSELVYSLTSGGQILKMSDVANEALQKVGEVKE